MREARFFWKKLGKNWFFHEKSYFFCHLISFSFKMSSFFLPFPTLILPRFNAIKKRRHENNQNRLLPAQQPQNPIKNAYKLWKITFLNRVSTSSSKFGCFLVLFYTSVLRKSAQLKPLLWNSQQWIAFFSKKLRWNPLYNSTIRRKPSEIIAKLSRNPHNSTSLTPKILVFP